ncbi:MAG: T9SS type B sorting domain-containing protein, partial [Daejeonella sp.]
VTSFSTTGSSVKVGTVTQTSGTTANNFSSPVTYRVTAADASTQDYVVTVSVVSNTTKAITAFTILGNGTVNESAKTIAVTVPFGTDLTALAASFSTTGSSVKVGTVTQTSGTTANNFSSPVTYRVTAGDASTQDYVVTISVAANPAKAITAFTILGNGTVNESAKTIAVTVPFGTDLTALVASFSTTGISLKVGTVTQTSGTTATNFSSPVTYRVTAADASTQDYVVTVSLGPDPQATPTFSPVAGAIVFGTEISIVSPGADAIYYTTDGTNPGTSAGGSTLLYNPSAKPIINAATTVKAIALKAGIPNSVVGSAAYTQSEAPDISNITISGSPYNYVFIPSTYVYLGVAFVNTITNITVTATGSGTIKIDGVAGSSASISLTAGKERIISIVAASPGRSDKTYTITVIRAKPAQLIPDSNGQSTVTTMTPEVLVTSPTQEINMTVASGTVEPKLDYGSMVAGGKGIVPKTTINSSLANVFIPAFTNITSSDTSWNGVLLAPTPSTATLPQTVPGEVKVVSSAIELGNSAVSLSFDNAVRVVMPGQTGTKVGYISPGSVFQEITTSGTDAQADANTLPTGGSYKVDNGTDMIVWTKHFTKFVTYTQKSTIAAITSTTYTIDSAAITKVPVGTEKVTFLAALTKGNVNQVWDVTGIDAIVTSGNVLISTAQDGITKVIYTVFINDPALTLMPGNAGSDQVLCDSLAAPLAETLPPAGGSGTYTYQWQKSVISALTGFTNISDATSPGYNPGILTQSTWFRRLVSSPGFTSVPAVSNVVSVTIVPALSNNKIIPPLLSAYCQSGDPSIISGSNPAGGDGTYTYQWQSSANGSVFTDITGATSRDYNPAVLTDTIYYQRVVNSGSCTSISNKITIYITQLLKDNTISAPDLVEFCSNADPEIITGSIPSNGNGIYLYQWQSSTISTTDGFINIPGATSKNYDPGSISQTTYYRRHVTYGFCTFSTNVIKIAIQSVVKSNIITAPSIVTFCQSGNPQPIIASLPNGGNGTFNYQWQSSTSSPLNGFKDIAGATSKDYDPALLTQTTYFRREITSGSCAYLSNAITLVVNPAVKNNIISSDQTVISGNRPLTLNGSIPTAGDGKYAYLWESSTTSNSSGFNPAEGSNTGQNYSPGILTNTTFFRRRVVSGICQVVYSNSIQILVTGVNTQPVALNDTYTTLENTALVMAAPGVLQNDTDPDNNLLTASVVTQPVRGTLLLNPDGSFTYTPEANFNGSDVFTYMACDNGNPQLCTTGTVIISVLGKPIIGLAKTVSTPLRQLDGQNSNILTYKIIVKNFGKVPLYGVQVVDDLLKTFPFPIKFVLEGIPVSSNNILKINGSYSGTGNNNLLLGTDVLPSGAIDTIKITLKVTPSNNMMGPFDNSASATATGSLGNVSNDISANGTNPDPDNNGIPDESSVTPVMLKKVTVRVPEGFSPNGDGVNDVLVIENLDNETISLHIYNAHGSLVYRNADYQNDWTGICNQGSLRGKDIPDGTYYYVISKRNNKENYVRFITIKR